jgi:hypothetical protein
VVVGRTRDAYSTREGETLQSRSDVDAITIQSLAFDDYIPQVDANAELHLPLLGQVGILLLEYVLNLYGAAHGIDHTGKLGQEIITRGIDHPTTVLLNRRGNHCAIGRKGTDSGFFIGAHETAVPRHIGAEDRRQLAFHADCRRLVRQRCPS